VLPNDGVGATQTPSAIEGIGGNLLAKLSFAMLRPDDWVAA